MYRTSPFRSTLNTGYITVCTEAVHSVALWTRVMCAQSAESHMCASAKECHHPHPNPPHPIPCDVCAGDSRWKKWCNIVPVCTCDSSLCARVTLENGGVRTWLQSVCAGNSGWKKMMQNCACVYLWLQSVCAGDPLTLKNWDFGPFGEWLTSQNRGTNRFRLHNS